MDAREKKADEKFCFECGEIIRVKAEICPKCGCRQPGAAGQTSASFDSFMSPKTEKSRTTAAIAAILLGGLGVHKFYLGKPIWGVIYLVLVLTFIPAIIGFIEGVHYLTMTDEEFQARYNNDTLSTFFGKK